MNSRRVLIACCPAVLTAVTAVTAQENPPLRVVPEVDLLRYSGQWYEIARLPNPPRPRLRPRPLQGPTTAHPATARRRSATSNAASKSRHASACCSGSSITPTESFNRYSNR